MDKLKNIVKVVIQWTYISVISLVLGTTTLYYILYIYTTYSSKGHDNFSKIITKSLPAVITFTNVAISHYGLEPVLKFKDVVVHDNAIPDKELFQTHELRLGIDWLTSLFQWQIKPNLLLVHGGKVIIYQNELGQINPSGSSLLTFALTKNIAKKEMALTKSLFEQSKIYFENISIEWRKTNGEATQFDNVNLKLYNDFYQHKLNLSGNLLQQTKKAANFNIELELHGDILQLSHFPLIGNIQIENWLPKINFTTFGKQNVFLPPSGNINLTIKNSQLTTDLLRQPLTINNASCKLTWQKNKNNYKVYFDNLRFQDNWLTLVGGGELVFKAATIWPEVDLHLGFKLTDLARANLYYPTTYMPRDVVSWLDQAFVGSKTFTGEMILRGPLANFPFDNGEGVFTVDSVLRDLSLRYDPAWPQINKLTGKMCFTGRALKIITQHAKIMEEPTKSITATIPDLDVPVLYIEGLMQNVASRTGLKFIRHSPLQKTIGAKLNNIDLSGKMNLDLKLVMPLTDKPNIPKTLVDGSIRLDNNTLHLYKPHWNIEKLTGNLHFDSNNFTANKIVGKLFSRPLKFAVNSLPINGNNILTNIAIDGNADITHLSKQLAPYAQGNIAYRALLTFLSNSDISTLHVMSNLQGVELKLPPPYGKQVLTQRHFDLKYQFNTAKNAYLDLNYNNQIYANLVLSQNNKKNLAITGGNVTIDTQPQEKKYNSQGLTVNGDLANLDWNVWKVFFNKWHNDFHSQVTANIEQIKLKIKKLQIWHQELSDVDLILKPHKEGCTVTILTKEIDGKIYFPENEKNPIKGEFKKFYLQQEKTSFSSQSLPALDLKIANFQYGDKKLNDVIIITSPLTTGLKIDKFNCRGATFTLESSGEWTITAKGQHTNFNGKLSTNNCGDMLRAWTLTDKIYGGDGKMNFALSWAGTPAQLNLNTARGNFNFEVTRGSISNLGSQTETKLALNRILNIFSVQSIANNFFLNWRNLTHKGLAFNSLAGDCLLENGHVELKKFNLDSSEVYVKSYGVLGIKDHDYNLMLSVTPRISVVAPAAFIGGPVAALAGLLVDDILSKAAKNQTHYSYHISGSWEKPVITKI